MTKPLTRVELEIASPTSPAPTIASWISGPLF
jgi:hypothetical protein